MADKLWSDAAKTPGTATDIGTYRLVYDAGAKKLVVTESGKPHSLLGSKQELDTFLTSL